jgi:hypothetical protein
MTDIIGREAYAFFNEKGGDQSQSGPRMKMGPVARVTILNRVDNPDEEGYQCKVIAGSYVEDGSTRYAPRSSIYVTDEEKQYFGQLVWFFLEGTPPTLKRPKTLEGDRIK